MGKLALINTFFALISISFHVPYQLNSIELLCWQVKDQKGLHLDDLMDIIRQMILIKWNNRNRVAQKFEGKILPHVV